MKGFLSRHDIDFEEHDVFADDEARAYVADLGAPGLPVVVVDGAWRSVFHPNQLADLLSTPEVAPSAPFSSLAKDLASVLDELEAAVADVPSDRLTTPTGVQGMDFRELVLFGADPLRMLPQALESRRFPWKTDREFRARRFWTTRDLALLFRDVRREWSERAAAAPAGIETVEVETARGPLTMLELLDTQVNRTRGVLRLVQRFARELT